MKILRGKVILIAVFFFLITSSGYSEVNKVRVVYTEWFPYTYEENGEPLGFEIEIFQAVLKTMNMEAVFFKYPWKRCLKNLEEGTSDALVSLLKTPEREKYTYFPDENISISKTVFFTTNEKDIEFQDSYEVFRGYTVGVISGFSYGDEFDNADYLKKDDVKNAQILIKMILNGRHDLAAENQAVINGYAKRMGVKDRIRFLEPPIHTQRLYAGFSKAKGLKDLCESFSESLKAFKNSEPYREILRKYGVSPSEMAEN